MAGSDVLGWEFPHPGSRTHRPSPVGRGDLGGLVQVQTADIPHQSFGQPPAQGVEAGHHGLFEYPRKSSATGRRHEPSVEYAGSHALICGAYGRGRPHPGSRTHRPSPMGRGDLERTFSDSGPSTPPVLRTASRARGGGGFAMVSLHPSEALGDRTTARAIRRLRRKSRLNVVL